MLGTRIESHALKLNKEEFNLNGVIVNCINDVTINNGKNVKLLYEPKDIIVEGDKGRLSQVISNLLSNALKFTTDGSIYIISEKRDDYAIVSIKDTVRYSYLCHVSIAVVGRHILDSRCYNWVIRKTSTSRTVVTIN